MRQDVTTALEAGEVVLIVANRREQRDAAKRELQLTICKPAGTA
jgi:hypothetical protein